MDGLQDAVDPSRSLAVWLRDKTGLSADEIAAVYANWAQWLEAMKLRQQDPAVRHSQDERAAAYQHAKDLDEARNHSRREAAKAAEAAKRARGRV